MRDLSAFIDSIRQDGIEAGKQVAAQLQSEAEEKAAHIVNEAEANAQRIVAAAEAQREAIVARTRDDLSLAARDTLARLRETIGTALEKILFRETRGVLEDPEFLAQLIRDIVQQYAQADAAGKHLLRVSVSESSREKLAKWTLAKLTDNARPDGLSLELQDGLAGAGLEYRIEGGTIEITPEAVVSVLSEFITTELSQLLSLELAAEKTGDPGGPTEVGPGANSEEVD